MMSFIIPQWVRVTLVTRARTTIVGFSSWVLKLRKGVFALIHRYTRFFG